MEGNSIITQDYLKVVRTACERGGAGASITGLAKHMEMAPSTAPKNVVRFVEEGLLAHEPYEVVTLPEEGRYRAVGMIRRHRILETYPVIRLGFSWDKVYAGAKELGHAVFERLLERLDAILRHPIHDPHGDPISTADGRLIVPDLVGPETLPVGFDGIVERIQDGTGILRRLERAGTGLGSRVWIRDRGTVAPAMEGGGRRWVTVIILLDNNVSRDAVPTGVSEVVIPDSSPWLLGWPGTGPWTDPGAAGG